MRLIMVSTGPFAAPTFRGLYETAHTVVALVTSPLRPQRSRRSIPAGPIRGIATDHGTPIFDPHRINTAEAQAQIAEQRADALVVCDYGQILSRETLETARLGGINVHGSLLPKYRGAAPVNWALYHGETETGVSIIHMSPELDAGPVIAQDRTPIDPDETAEQLEARLADMGARLVPPSLEALETGRVQALPQDAALASMAPRLKKTDGWINWDRPALAVKNHIRAVQPWPKAFTFWHRPDGAPLRLIVGAVEVVDAPSPTGPGGTVLEASGDRLIVAAGEGALSLTRLQPAGKRWLPVEEFLRGYRVEAGQTFGSE